MKCKKKTQQLTLAAFFVALQVVMTLTPIGYIPIGALSITTMHIPVILAGILFGEKFGAGIGFVFGLTSLLRATFEPSVTSFVFTPFITIGGISGNFFSLVIVFVPRILLGFLASKLYKLFNNYLNDTISIIITSFISTMLHTILVLIGIYVFFGEAYANACGIDISLLGSIMIGVVCTNGILEMILAAIVEPVIIKALNPAATRMGLRRA